MVSPEMVVLSVFITPWMKPTCIQRATSDACGLDDCFEQGEVRVGRVSGVGVVAGDGVVGQSAHECGIAAGRGVLERADAQVAGGDTGEHSARQHAFAHDALAGGHNSKRTCGGDAQCVHRLADDVLAQHRSDGGLAVATSCERRAARPLQVQVSSPAVRVDDLADQQRPSIAESRRVTTELVPRVRLRHGPGTVRNLVADQHRNTARGAQRVSVEAQFVSKLLVQYQQVRRRRGRSLPRLVQTLQLIDKRVLEGERRADIDTHT